MAQKAKKGGGLPTTGLVSIVLACLFMAGADCSIIWNKHQIHWLGLQIRACETKLDEAKRRRLSLERDYVFLCSHAHLEQQVQRMNLDLRPPQPEQMVRLPEVAPGRGTPEKLFAVGGAQ